MATMTMAPPLQAASAQKRKLSTAGLTASGRPVKRRASKACQCCRSRKVRCDVVESGMPCTNCRLDEVECCVTEGKRRKKSCIETDILQHSPSNSGEEHEEITQFSVLDDIDGLQDLTLPLKNTFSTSLPATPGQETSHHKPHMLYQNHGQRLTPEECSRRLSIVTSGGASGQNPAAPTPSFFLPFQPSNQAVLPRYVHPVPDRILAEDIDYLQKKGAFLIPETGLRDELLRCYVQFVHPFLPLLDLEEFLGAIHRDDATSTVSLLLFQAAMFAATAYIDMRYLMAQGYDSRKQARKAFFTKAKLLYDFDYEIDRVTVVQSVLLMTYWYESPDDPKDIPPLSAAKQKLWKRIWWCCYTRDRLVAIGMRRPIRVEEGDFDVSALEISDFDIQPLAPELNRMLGACSAVRDGSKREMLARMFIALIQCCQCMTRVLTTQYSMLGHRLGATQETTMRLVPRRSAANAKEVMACDRELEAWYESLPVDVRYFKKTENREPNVLNDGDVLNLHRALLTGVYLTTASALHRPQMMPAMPNLLIEAELKDLSKRRVRDAAGAITDIFHDLYSRDLVRFLPNTGVTILLPAIIVHLLDIKSPDSVTRQLSARRFQFCMRALQRLRDMYASADFAFSFLDAAIQKADVPMHDEPYQRKQSRRHAQSINSYRPLVQQAPRGNSHHRSMSMIHMKSGHEHIGLSSASSLTPPPEHPFSTFMLEQTRWPSASAAASLSPASSTSDSIFINPRATSLPMTYNDSILDGSVLTPPNSETFPQISERTMRNCYGTSLVDIVSMHHNSGTSSHDEQHMAVDADVMAGYVEADKLTEMVDEEAMMKDFDQLINLEGGNSISIEQLFPETLAETTANGSIDGALDEDFWSSVAMPILDENSCTSPVKDASTPGLPFEAARELAAATRESNDLRQKIMQQ